jgi:hypothetical protein
MATKLVSFKASMRFPLSHITGDLEQSCIMVVEDPVIHNISVPQARSSLPDWGKPSIIDNLSGRVY